MGEGIKRNCSAFGLVVFSKSFAVDMRCCILRKINTLK